MGWGAAGVQLILGAAAALLIRSGLRHGDKAPMPAAGAFAFICVHLRSSAFQFLLCRQPLRRAGEHGNRRSTRGFGESAVQRSLCCRPDPGADAAQHRRPMAFANCAAGAEQKIVVQPRQAMSAFSQRPPGAPGTQSGRARSPATSVDVGQEANLRERGVLCVLSEIIEPCGSHRRDHRSRVSVRTVQLSSARRCVLDPTSTSTQ